jgi:protein pelota
LTSVKELNQITGIAALLTFPLDIEMVEAEEALFKQEQQERQVEAG